MRAWIAWTLLVVTVAAAGAEFPEPTNIAAIAGYCEMDDGDLTRLRENGLLVVARKSATNLYSCYYGLEMAGLPVYVTSDAMLYLWYEAHREAMKAAERQALRPELIELVGGLLERTQTLRAQADDALLRENAVMLSVALALLEPGHESPADLADNVAAEVARVIEHTLVQVYPGEDYTQYTVRGYYTEDEELASYSRGAKYLARRYLRVADPNFPADADRELRRAALLALALREGEGLRDLYREAYDLRAFLAGPADTIRLDQLLGACDAVWGEGWSRAATADLAMLREELTSDRYPVTRINTRFTPGAAIMMPPRNVAVLGEHYLPDSELFHHTTEPRVPGRHLPSGLDVATALGSEAAAEKLTEIAPGFPGIVSAAQRFGSEMSSESIYGDWLDTLRTLFDRPEGLPAFARTPGYEDKQINCCLASWSQLRHNYILYGAQASMCTGLTSGGGLVEPLPEFFANYARMCARLEERLQADGVEGRVTSVVERLREKAETFERCAADQLAGRDTAWARDDIHGFGSWIMGVFFDSPLVVADVATSSETREVLHAASGPFHPIAVLAEDAGQWLGAVGYVGSYYEFAEPNMGRLTDAEWQSRLDATYTRPEPPEWLAGLYPAQPVEGVQARQRLRELETMLRDEGGDQAVAAVEAAMVEWRDTKWEPAGALLLARHLVAAEQYQRVTKALARLDLMYGSDARDEARHVLRSAEWHLKRPEREQETALKLEEALADTEPREGLTPEQEIERQNKRAEMLLDLTPRDPLGTPSKRTQANMQRLLEDCPNSGYVPFAELALALAHWTGRDYFDSDADFERNVEQLRAQLLPLAEKYSDSVIGQAARAAATSLHYLVGDLEPAWQEAMELVKLAPPDPEPYPLSTRQLDETYWDRGLYGDPTISAEALMESVVDRLLVQSFIAGDIPLAMRVAASWAGDPRSGNDPDTVRAHLAQFGDELGALADIAPILAVWMGNFDRANFDAVATRALDVAGTHPGTKSARAALFCVARLSVARSLPPRVQERIEQAVGQLGRDYPDSLENLVAQVVYHNRHERYDQALPFFQQLVKLVPGEEPEGGWPSHMEDIHYDIDDPAQLADARDKNLAANRKRYGSMIGAAGLPDDYLDTHGSQREIVRELLQRLPDRQFDLLETCSDYLLRELAPEVLDAHPDDPRALETRWKLGGTGNLMTIIAAGPDTPHFDDAVGLVTAWSAEGGRKLRESVVSLTRAADRHRGTPAEALAIAAAGKTYLSAARPEQAIELLEKSLARMADDQMFRDRAEAQLASARRQISVKRGSQAQQVWEVHVLGTRRRTSDGYAAGLPALAAGRLYLDGSVEGGGSALLCLDAATGETLWQAPCAPAFSAALLDDAVVVGTDRGTVLCVDAVDGEMLWRRELGLGQAGAVRCGAGEGVVVVWWDHGLLCALDAATGETIWERDEVLFAAAPVVGTGLAFAHDAGGVLHAWRLEDGSEAWTWDFRKALPEETVNDFRYTRDLSATLVGGRLLVFAGGSHGLGFALEARSGEVLWTRTGLGPFFFARGPGDRVGMAVEKSEGGSLRCTSLVDGGMLWSLPLPSSRCGGMASLGDSLLVGQREECLLVDWRLGGIVGRYPGIRSSRGVLAETTDDGVRLYAFSGDDVVCWQVETAAE